MNILVTGSNGQLGSELKVLAKTSDGRFFFTDVADLDILDSKAINSFFKENKIEACINCAAYTAVDKAETELDLAHKVNVKGPANLAMACSDSNAILVHISTDFVFDGTASRPYGEFHPVNPVSVYGKTKIAGEQMVMSNNDRTYIIRTAWLYSAYGNNFVKTMLRLGAERAELGIISDQIGSPTYAADLAKMILTMLAANKERYGIYHYSNEGVASWYDFAKAIFELKGLTVKVKPLRTEDYPTPAQRPSYSVLNKLKIKETFGIEIPYWKESLKICLELI